MKVRPLSDLHLETGDPFDLAPAGEDLIILAGDIAMHVQSVAVARRFAETTGSPVVLIAGNHEFYRGQGQAHTWEGVDRWACAPCPLNF